MIFLLQTGIIGRMKELEDADVQQLPIIGIAKYGAVYVSLIFACKILLKVGVLENIGDWYPLQVLIS